MSLPTLQLQVAPGYHPLDPAKVWTTAPATVRAATTRRGRNRESDTFGAGTMSVRAKNTLRVFDPGYAAGPFAPYIGPDVPIRLLATWLGTDYPVWTGLIDIEDLSWSSVSDGEAAIAAVDIFELLNRDNIRNDLYPLTVAAYGATGYWRLGDIVLPIAMDSSGGGHHGHYAGTPALAVPGALVADIDGAMDCTPGIGGGVVLDNYVPILGAGAWSLLVWLKATGEGFSSVYTQALASGTGVTNLMSIYYQNRSIYVQAYNAGAVTGVAHQDDVIVEDGKWHMVALTRAADGRTCRYYLDGRLRATMDAGAAFAITGTPGASSFGSASGTFVGPSSLQIDEVATFAGVELSAAQVANLWGIGDGSWGEQLTGARVATVLDNVGVPAAMRSIEVGNSLVQAVDGSLAATSALVHLQAVAAVESGSLYIDEAGKVVFRDRYHNQLVAGAGTVQAVFSDAPLGAGELPYVTGSVKVGIDRTQLWNRTQIAARGSAPIQVDDLGSQNGVPGVSQPHGVRLLQLGDLLLARPAEGGDKGQHLLSQYAQPRERISELKIDPRADPALWPKVLGLKIGDLITVRRRPTDAAGNPVGPTISQNVRIEQVAHDINAKARSWITTYSTSPDFTRAYAICDDPITGFCDIGLAGY